MRWMICWNEEGRKSPHHYREMVLVADAIVCSMGFERSPARVEYRKRLLAWFLAAQLGDVLKFPLGIVVRTSEQEAEIDYEETD